MKDEKRREEEEVQLEEVDTHSCEVGTTIQAGIMFTIQVSTCTVWFTMVMMLDSMLHCFDAHYIYTMVQVL